MFRILATLLVLFIFWLLGFAEGNAAPTWGGGGVSNGISSEKDLPSKFDKADALWETKLGTHIYSIPTIVGGRIYIGSNDGVLKDSRFERTNGGIVNCLDEATGKMIWQLVVPRFRHEDHFFNHLRCGIVSSPVVEGDRVYVVSSRGEMLCLDANGQADGNAGPFTDEVQYMSQSRDCTATLRPSDGDIIWRYDFVTPHHVFPHDCCGSTVLIDGNLLYMNTSHGVARDHKTVRCHLAPSMLVFDKRDGRLIARDNEKIGRRMLHGQWSTPIVGEVGGKKLIYFGGGDGLLYAFAPPALDAYEVQTLEKVWSLDCNPPQYRTREDGTKIRYTTRQIKSPEGPSEIIATPVLLNDRLYVCIGQDPMHGVGWGNLLCLDAASGAEIWSSSEPGRSLSTVSISKGLLYLSDFSANLHCFDATTGERYWVHDLESGVWSSSTLVADGKIYVSTDKRVMWVLAEGKEKKVISKSRLKDMAVTPVAANGKLYIATQRSISAWGTQAAD
jgi:outer membrane protein assembly factor BamB